MKVGDKLFRVFRWTKNLEDAITEVEVLRVTRNCVHILTEKGRLEKFSITPEYPHPFELACTYADAIELLLADAQKWLKIHESRVADSVKRIGSLRLQLAEEVAAQVEAEVEAEQAAGR